MDAAPILSGLNRALVVLKVVTAYVPASISNWPRLLCTYIGEEFHLPSANRVGIRVRGYSSLMILKNVPYTHWPMSVFIFSVTQNRLRIKIPRPMLIGGRINGQMSLE